jgi:flagellar basal body-associated protein FliL
MAEDQAAQRAWIILGVLVAVFMLGLVLVSFWGGPFESDSWWLKETPPTFPN